MKLVSDFNDYEIIDMAHGEKLERWGSVTLVRPDPQIIWNEESTNFWNKADAIYARSNTGGGQWKIKKNVPSSWIINYQDLKFNLKFNLFFNLFFTIHIPFSIPPSPLHLLPTPLGCPFPLDL